MDAEHYGRLRTKGHEKTRAWRVSVSVTDGNEQQFGGERGIRTLVRVTPKQHFQCCAFDRSATSPYCQNLSTITYQRGRNKYYVARRRATVTRYRHHPWAADHPEGSGEGLWPDRGPPLQSWSLDRVVGSS